MPDFDTRNILDDDRVEITDLDLQNDGSSTSISIVLLRFIRKIPLFANTRARSTALALLTCVLMLLFLVQPGLPDIPRQASSTSALATSYAVDVQSPLSNIGAPPANKVTWIKISNGKVIEIQASPGTIVWNNCKVQHWFIPRKYAHPTIVICH
ncbi:MAG TPA: hypothetical protein VFZ02_10120 [Ktedonobacteraceae bacterium]